MNTTKCRKYEVIKESTYVYPKYNIRIPMKVGDKYVVVGFTYHKMFCVTLFKMPTTLRRQNFLFLKVTSKSILEYIWRKQHNGQVLKILFMVCFCHSYDVLCHSSVISLITNYSRESIIFAAISIRRVYYV